MKVEVNMFSKQKESEYRITAYTRLAHIKGQENICFICCPIPSKYIQFLCSNRMHKQCFYNARAHSIAFDKNTWSYKILKFQGNLYSKPGCTILMVHPRLFSPNEQNGQMSKWANEQMSKRVKWANEQVFLLI